MFDINRINSKTICQQVKTWNMYKIVVFACCCLVLACEAASIIRPLKEKMEKQYNCQLDNVDIEWVENLFN